MWRVNPDGMLKKRLMSSKNNHLFIDE